MADRRYRKGYDFLYTRVGFALDGDSICFYCGLPATCEDHTFPLIFLDAMLKSEGDIPYDRLFVVPSCKECNGILNTNVFPHLRMRKQYLKRRLARRYKKLLIMPDWRDIDLVEMSQRLVHDIELHLAKKEQIKQRLAY